MAKVYEKPQIFHKEDSKDNRHRYERGLPELVHPAGTKVALPSGKEVVVTGYIKGRGHTVEGIEGYINYDKLTPVDV